MYTRCRSLVLTDEQNLEEGSLNSVFSVKPDVIVVDSVEELTVEKGQDWDDVRFVRFGRRDYRNNAALRRRQRERTGKR